MRVHVKARNHKLTNVDRRLLQRHVHRLERRLETFEPDLVQLDLTIDKHARREEYRGSVRLFVVNRTLTAARNTGGTAGAMMQAAFSDIEDQLERYKAELRGEPARRHARPEVILA
jgi:ribosome-associated translation inhibitor RaiA